MNAKEVCTSHDLHLFLISGFMNDDEVYHVIFFKPLHLLVTSSGAAEENEYLFCGKNNKVYEKLNFSPIKANFSVKSLLLSKKGTSSSLLQIKIEISETSFALFLSSYKLKAFQRLYPNLKKFTFFLHFRRKIQYFV